MLRAVRTLQRSLLAAGIGVVLVVSARAQFETRISYSVLSEPGPIAVGDFNHDGKLDFAIADTCCPDGNIAVFLGKGDGTFQPAVYYPAGVGPVSIAAADFNHDGNLDLVVAGLGSTYLSILLGKGDGTFQPAKQSPPLATYATFVAVGDFNNDGKLDLLANTDNNPCLCLSVLLGNGDGTFQPPISTPLSFSVLAIGVGDFNRDGNLDLATGGTFGAATYVNILLGNGDGTFRQGANYPADVTPSSMAVTDFNKDGNLDLAIDDGSDIGVSVLLGNGDGTFQPAVDYAASFPSEVVVADFNLDGKLDMAVANIGLPGGAVGVFLGNGDGTFQPVVSYNLDSYSASSLAVGDFNGDHRPDLVVADLYRDTLTVLLNTGVVSFTPITPLSFPSQLVGAVSAPQTVTLTNTGTTALTISSISVSSGQFNMTNTCGKGVAPGGNCAITAAFQPRSKGGKSGIISIRDSASTKPQVIELTGVGTYISVSPSMIDFGSRKVGTRSKPQPVTVTNHGSTALNISAIKINRNDYGYYSQSNNCGSQIAAGAGCKIAVTFDPLAIGKSAAQLAISDDGGASPQVVLLTGSGT